MKPGALFSAALGLALGAIAPAADGATSLSEAGCEGLAVRDWTPVGGSAVEIRTAAAVSPDDEGLPDYCRVQATIAPSTGVEIRLPLSGWNRRLLFTGCGGLCGVIYSQHMPDAQARGYAVATTDMGRQLDEGEDPREWTQDEQWRTDWQYRATHSATVLAKAVIAEAYGQAQDYAYFRGCSTGGRQGLTEALMYPEDYDGVISGAPAMQMVTPHNVFSYASSKQPDGSPVFSPQSLHLLADAVLEACDEDDGVRDGVVPHPPGCSFDPASLECADGQSGDCLTAEQVKAVRKIHDGARKSDGSRYYPMGYARGSERDWITNFLVVDGRPPRRAGSARFTLDSRIGPDATLAEFDYARHGVQGSPVGGMLDLGDDGRRLAAFRDRGGKILLYHGWSDTDATPASSLFFHESHVRAFGREEVSGFLRLFMLPGMAHCSGGEGVHAADYLTLLEEWVEEGEAPESLDAYKTRPSRSGETYPGFPLPPADIVSGRRLYPYPAHSAYGGKGDVNDPANWHKR
ncbi:MAG: tannase/feruloyl esterase family alpha/beta hydrolase [Gammaproteobacteria bacterium]|nr:tannase/feruloyl esterase family alpha/beta hydrolase [Gammaproteobacteria bacterium]MYF67472.1 tannase/feruloyl esterase family alpha/beta hydrolase [Gammaproteobacteria bacterium]MYK37422.1 tannase/feruloyl esterase family alpha/beta hydrolase [Gammaproteobacteria bacterium]